MLKIFAVVLISVLLYGSIVLVHAIPPLERVWSREPVIVDNNHITLCCRGLYHAIVNDGVIIQSNITSNFDGQSFAHIVKITDSEGITVFLSWIESKLGKNESTVLAQSWMPDGIGLYTVEMFDWDSVDNPDPLGPVRTVELVVTSDKTGDFNIRLDRTDVELREGAWANVGVILTSINGFDSKVNLSVEVSCKCLEATLKPRLVTLSPYSHADALLTVKVNSEKGDWGSGVPLAYAAVGITGKSSDGLLQRSAQVIIVMPQS